MQPRLRDHAAAALFLAVGLTLIANVLLPLQDALTKQLIVDLPVWAVLFVRSTTVFAATLLIGRGQLVARMQRTQLKRFMTIRAFVMLAGWITFYLAARHLPLAQAITLYFLSPILVTIAAKPFLGERTPLLQWIGILAGFAGVALASRLVEFELSPAIGLALLSACLWAASLLMLRSVSREEGTLVQVAFCNGVFAVATLVPVLVQGFTASASTVMWMIAVGFVGGAGQFCLYEAARRVPAPVLSALEYTSILSAFALGYLMFGEVPTPQIWVGAALILMSGMIVVGVERDRIKSAAPLARDLPTIATAGVPLELPQESRMTDKTHDAVVNYIARTRFPFPGQKTWAPDYQTLTNVPQRKRAIKRPPAITTQT